MRRPARRWVLVILLGALLGAAYAGLIGLRVLYPMRFTEIVLSRAAEHGLDPAFVASVIRAESRFKPGAVSPQGAIGLMQIMPTTGEWIATQIALSGYRIDDLYDPHRNIQLGTWYLATLLDRFGDASTALQAYNAGPSNADRWRATGESPYPETAAYVDRVLNAIPVYRFYLRFPGVLRITPSIAL